MRNQTRPSNAAMKFGLFTSAQANSGDLGPESGQGFRDYLDFNVAAEALGFQSSFLVEHHFTGWNQVSATLMLLMALARPTKTLTLVFAAGARFAGGVAGRTRPWTTRQRCSHRGRFWHFQDIVVEPPPAQNPHPPLWV